MNRKLQTNTGFTLVELLVVISIIAILSVIAMTIYGDVQKRSRDGRRKADINAIADAMETNYSARYGVYAALAYSMFSQGVTPQDPVATNVDLPDSACPGVCKYCVRQHATEVQTAGNCTKANNSVGPNSPTGNAVPNWIVCANLEAADSNGLRYYCRKNIQ